MKRLVLIAALLATPVLAQRAAAPRGPSAPPEAAGRYHEAARLYVDGENVPALAAAEAAVALAPGDARAVALRDLIKKKQDEKNQNQQNQDGEQPPPDDGPQPPPDDGEKDDPGDTSGQDGQEPPPGGEEPGPQNPGGKSEMSPEQAQRILDAVGGDERMLLRQMRRPPSRVRTNEADW